MSKVHFCNNRKDVLIVKEDTKINIKRPIDNTFSDILVGNIGFCPFCGLNLAQAKK